MRQRAITSSHSALGIRRIALAVLTVLGLLVPPSARAEALAFTTASLPEAVVGEGYVYTVSAGEGCTYTSDSLPVGLHMDAQGTLYGIPTGTGRCSFTITATRGTDSIRQSFSLKIVAVRSGKGVLYEGSRGDDVKKLQARLMVLGYLEGTADGIFGTKTRRAVQAYQAAIGATETGVTDEALLRRLYSGDAIVMADLGQIVVTLRKALADDGPLLQYSAYLAAIDALTALNESRADQIRTHLPEADISAFREADTTYRLALNYQCAALERQYADQATTALSLKVSALTAYQMQLSAQWVALLEVEMT